MMYSFTAIVMYIVANTLVFSAWIALNLQVVAAPIQPPASALPITPRPHVVLRTTVKQTTSAVGGLLTFSLHVMNYGDRSAETVQVVDELPRYLQLAEVTTSQGRASAKGNRVLVELGSLDPGSEVQIFVRALVGEDAPSTGRNTATLNNHSSSTATFRIADGTPVVTVAQRVRLPATATSGGLGNDYTSLAALFLIGTMKVVLGARMRRGG